MAAKVVRQINRIALLGAPTSAASMSVGHESAPSALRAAGLAERLRRLDYAVSDLGDDAKQIFKVDEASPRARNLPAVLKSLESLKPRVEEAVKSGALPLILGGDCTIALATIAGVRRYFRHVGLLYIDRDADLYTPASTSSGCVDGMVVSHLTGRGAAELVRFWGEPPLVREPDLALFGTERMDPLEEETLRRSMLRSYSANDIRRKGAVPAAEAALTAIHGATHEFVLHLDVDVIEDFQATGEPASGGLRLEELREALGVFSAQKHLAAIEVTGYNPAKDPDGIFAKMIIDLLSDAFSDRLKLLEVATSASDAPDGDRPAAKTDLVSPAGVMSVIAGGVGEAWSSEVPNAGSEAQGEKAQPEAQGSGPESSAGRDSAVEAPSKTERGT